MKKTIVFIFFSTVFFGCNSFTGDEISRITFNSVSSEDSLIIKETSINLNNGDRVAFWSEIDIEYEKEIYLLFQIQIFKENQKYGGLEIDPTKKNITIGELKTSRMGKTKWKYTGKNATIKIPENGNYTFKANFISNDNSSLIVNKAIIILKK